MCEVDVGRGKESERSIHHYARVFDFDLIRVSVCGRFHLVGNPRSEASNLDQSNDLYDTRNVDQSDDL